MQCKMQTVSLLCLFASFVAINADYPSECPKIVSKKEWGALTPKQVEYSIVPTQYVIIHHTVTPSCDTNAECVELTTNIQNFHMDDLKFHDIGYNFLIGGNGVVYEGAGWHKVGAHTIGYNTRSLGIALIGNFSDKMPTAKQLQALKDFLNCGIEIGELDAKYKLLGGRQVSKTLSPGLQLYQELQKWSHFTRI